MGVRTTVGDGCEVHPKTFIDGWGDLSELPFRVADVVLGQLQYRAGLLALHRHFLFHDFPVLRQTFLLNGFLLS